MTEMESRNTYGLLSKTILHTLADRNIQSEEIFIFSLHMQWGIILGHPYTSKSTIAADMLQRLTEKTLQVTQKTELPDFTGIFNDNSACFLKIYKRISTHLIHSDLTWYTNWKAHCSRLLTNEPGIENCFQLFLILKDCMDVKYEEFLLAMTVIHETLQHA